MSDNIKDNKKDVANKAISPINSNNSFNKLFLNNQQTFLSKKIERLTSALYVITGFIPNEEPVRNRLRSRALDLIRQSSTPSSLSRDGVDAFRAAATEIGILLQTAHSAGLISRMNSELLCDEYASLALFVAEQSDLIQAPVENGPDAVIDSMRHLDTPKDQKRIDYYKGHNVHKGQNGKNGKKGQDYRRSVLIALLDKKDKISINDAVSSIEGCSEKTIQRELLALVRDGIAVKEGERRWSVYRKAPKSQIVTS